MTTETKRSALRSSGVRRFSRRPCNLKHMAVSGVSFDVVSRPVGERTGSKRDAENSIRAGGAGPNGNRVAVANGIPSGVVGVQSADLRIACEELLRQDGIQPMIAVRPATHGAVTVAHPNGSPGTFDLEVQRMKPMAVGEMTRAMCTAIRSANTLFVGPTPVDADTRKYHEWLTLLGRRRALMAHPSLLADPNLFSDIGGRFNYVQMTHEESGLVDPSARGDLPKTACRVRFLLGDGVDFAITNGAKNGLAWIAGRWHQIVPSPVAIVVSDIGAGDVWGAAFFLAREHFSASPEAAIEYANRAAAAWVGGKKIPPYI